MIVYRIMSEKEYENWKNSGVKGLFSKNGKTKRIVWFATDIAYVGTILMRKVYNNRSVKEAYTKIVMFDLTLSQEIEVKLKPENGFVNIGIKAKYMDMVKLKELGCCEIDFHIKLCLKREIRPLMYYWNREDKGQEVVRKKDVKNLIWNGNLRKRAWFMRADVYGLYMKMINEKVIDYG